MMFLLLGLRWLTVALVGLCFFINGCFMLISPKAWFRLPRWFPARGPLSETKYGSGSASMQVRILGAIFIAFPVWCLMGFSFR
jgi:hypothetical protein